MNIGTAKELATKFHEGQTRWDGEPYINHPDRIAQEVKSYLFHRTNNLNLVDCTVVAWLHDTVEDTDLTFDYLLNETDIQDWQFKALVAITHRKNESYVNYIQRVATNKIATLVKKFDLKDNLIDLKEGQRKDKYELAHLFLDRI